MKKYNLLDKHNVDYNKPKDFYKNISKQIFPGLESGSVGLIVGPSGCSKTAFATMMGMCASGINFDLPARPEGVFKTIYLSAEDTSLQHFNRGLALKKSLNNDYNWDSSIKNFMLYSIKDMRPDIMDNQFIDFMIKSCLPHDLCIIDTFSKFHKLNENDNSEMNRVMSNYSFIAEKSKCAILIIHHTGRPPKGDDGSYFISQYAARGATAITDSARLQINLFRSKHYSKPFKGFNDKEQLIGYKISKANNIKLEETEILKTRSINGSYVIEKVNTTISGDFDDAYTG